MGTIAQKLTYLEDTKTAIGNAIAAKGGSVTGKTFRQYATEISNLPSGGGGTPIAVAKDVSDYTSGTSFDIKKQITGVNFPNGVTSIANSSFENMSGITSVTIPSGVTSIGDRVFYGCSGLTSVTIPNSVTSIGIRAFYSTSINTVITENISNYCLITTGDMWISSFYDLYEGNTLVQNITIPNTVTEIPSRKFYKCTSLQSVTIPDTVTKINPYAFSGCSNLSSVTCLATTPPSMVSWYTYFDDTDANLVIYVPAASVEAYKAASGWSSYASRIQAIPSE